jgi:phosphoribosylformimino-5-aminoimidazole carboxamide ribotide isomerase
LAGGDGDRRLKLRRFSSVLIIPAIDLKDGNVVRLKQGRMKEATVFSNRPGEIAAKWKSQGARRIHVVDLNGAAAGRLKNLSAIRDIVDALGEEVPVQLGGGIRDLDTIEECLDNGISYVIIGTAAVKTPGFLHDACSAFSGHVIAALDAKDGKVAVDGWSKCTGHDAIDLAKKFQDYGVEAIIYTDIGRDGMMTGINIEATLKLAQQISVPVIASGGITDLDDIKRLCALEPEGVTGAITGIALYQGALDLAAAQKLADELGGTKAEG